MGTWRGATEQDRRWELNKHDYTATDPCIAIEEAYVKWFRLRELGHLVAFGRGL